MFMFIFKTWQKFAVGAIVLSMRNRLSILDLAFCLLHERDTAPFHITIRNISAPTVILCQFSRSIYFDASQTATTPRELAARAKERRNKTGERRAPQAGSQSQRATQAGVQGRRATQAAKAGIEGLRRQEPEDTAGGRARPEIGAGGQRGPGAPHAKSEIAPKSGQHEIREYRKTPSRG